MTWKAIIASVAPTLATALGGPLAGMAVKTIGDALGLDKATEESVSTALQGASPETLLALKQADQEFAAKMRDLDIKLEELETKDRDSARNLLIQTRARTPAVLSWVIVIATLALEGGIIFTGLPEKLPDIVTGRILGSFDLALGIVLNFWLGAAHRDPANRGLQN